MLEESVEIRCRAKWASLDEAWPSSDRSYRAWPASHRNHNPYRLKIRFQNLEGARIYQTLFHVLPKVLQLLIVSQSFKKQLVIDLMCSPLKMSDYSTRLRTMEAISRSSIHQSLATPSSQMAMARARTSTLNDPKRALEIVRLKT